MPLSAPSLVAGSLRAARQDGPLHAMDGHAERPAGRAARAVCLRGAGLQAVSTERILQAAIRLAVAVPGAGGSGGSGGAGGMQAALRHHRAPRKAGRRLRDWHGWAGMSGTEIGALAVFNWDSS